MSVVDPGVGYQDAARALLRDSVLDAMRALLTERDWSKVTLSDVAKRVGVSRQTLYNEFGSRSGLAQGYAVRLVDKLADHVDTAIWANVGDVESALTDAVRAFFLDTAVDPLIVSLHTGEAKPDLLRLITIDAAPITTRATARLVELFRESWVRVSLADAEILARAVVRLALSYVSMPPEADRDVPADLATLIAPFVHAAIARAQG